MFVCMYVCMYVHEPALNLLSIESSSHYEIYILLLLYMLKKIGYLFA